MSDRDHVNPPAPTARPELALEPLQITTAPRAAASTWTADPEQRRRLGRRAQLLAGAGHLQPDRGRDRHQRRPGRRVGRADRVRAGLGRRGLQRPDHLVAVPPPPPRDPGTPGAAAARVLVLRPRRLRRLRVDPDPDHRRRPGHLTGRDRAGDRVADHHAVAVLGAAPHRQGARLQRRRRRLHPDPAVHLPVRRPAARPGAERDPRLGLGRPDRRTGHRRRRGPRRARSLARRRLLLTHRQPPPTATAGCGCTDGACSDGCCD